MVRRACTKSKINITLTQIRMKCITEKGCVNTKAIPSEIANKYSITLINKYITNK
jgi:hypothetical protein